MGFMRGFVGGVADAAKDLAFQELKNKSARELVEAQAVREQALAEYREDRADNRAAEQRTFLSGEREATQGFTAGESELERESKERIATNRKGAAPKVFKTMDDEGNEVFMRYDSELDEMVPVSPGSKDGGQRVSLDQAMSMARREADAKASWFKTDKTDFGMTREEWINQRAMEIANSGTGGGPAPGASSRDPLLDILQSEMSGEKKPGSPGSSAGIIGSVMAESKDGNFDPDKKLPADTAVALIEARKKGGRSTKQTLAAFAQAKELAKEVEHKYSRGTISRVSTGDLRIAVAGGYLSKAAHDSAERELARR